MQETLQETQEEEIPAPSPAISMAEPIQENHNRFDALVKAIEVFHRERFPRNTFLFKPADDRAVRNFLSGNGADLNIEELQLAVAGYYGSVHAAVISVQALVKLLMEYRSGPQNQFNEPEMFTDRLDRWSAGRLHYLRKQLGHPPPEQLKFEASAETKLPPDMDAAAGAAAWEHIREDLKKRINPLSFSTWLAPLRPIGMIAQMLYLRIPLPEFHYIEEKFGDLLMEAMKASQGVHAARELVLLTMDEQATHDFLKNTPPAGRDRQMQKASA